MNMIYRRIDWLQTQVAQVIPAMLDIIKNAIQMIVFNKGTSLFLLTLVLLCVTETPLIWTIISAIGYCMILLRELLDHKKEHDTLKLIDVKFFEDEQKNFEGPLDAFIDTCFNEQLIMTRGWREGQYISKNEEKQMMQDLIDLMARNMGPMMKRKLELYYGPGMVDDALVRKAYIKVSLYVANTNKVLYTDVQKKPKGGSIDDLLREAMINQAKVA